MRWLDEPGFTLVEVLAAVSLILVISAVTIPLSVESIQRHRLRADAQAVNNMVGLAKMRAASTFTRVRLRADLTEGTYTVERWDKVANVWVPDGTGVGVLSTSVTFGFGGLDTPPPNTQGVLDQSPPCLEGLDAGSDEIADTACIVFNSRGLPVDGDGLLFGGHAVYLTDGVMTWGTTITATPRIRLWSTPATAANWSEQQ